MSAGIFALVDNGSIRKINVSQSLQGELAALFRQQAANFLADHERIKFDPHYVPSEDELSVIESFPLPLDVQDAATSSLQVDNLDLSDQIGIKAIVSTEVNDGQVTVYFQAFNRQRLLKKSWTLLQQHDTYQKVTDPGLTLDTKLVAIYTQGALVFRQFETVRRFLDLSKYFVEASDSDIKEMLTSKVLVADRVEDVIEVADNVLRRRFMELKSTGVLQHVSPKKIVATAKKYGVAIKTRGGKVVFPADRKSAKELIAFLTESYYQGDLTGTKYIANSHRPLA